MNFFKSLFGIFLLAVLGVCNATGADLKPDELVRMTVDKIMYAVETDEDIVGGDIEKTLVLC
jgi:hypothetical protein